MRYYQCARKDCTVGFNRAKVGSRRQTANEEHRFIPSRLHHPVHRLGNEAPQNIDNTKANTRSTRQRKRYPDMPARRVQPSYYLVRSNGRHPPLKGKGAALMYREFLRSTTDRKKEKKDSREEEKNLGVYGYELPVIAQRRRGATEKHRPCTGKVREWDVGPRLHKKRQAWE